MRTIKDKADKEIVIGLVEDNKDDAKFFEKLLKDCRAFHLKRIDYYNSGEACLEKLAYSADIDIIIMDYNLGKNKMNGLECIRKLKASERTRGIRIIILTNEDYAPEDIVESLDAGATAFLRKKSDKFALESAIRDAYYGRWTTYTSVISDLIGYLKNKHRTKTAPIPDAPMLSALECEIIKKVAEGKSNETLIAELKPNHDKFFDTQTKSYRTLSLDTLRRTILPQIYAKFGIDTGEESQSRIKLASLAFKYGIVRADDLEITPTFN